MSKLIDKLKRMDPFHANAKQQLLMNNIKEPDFDLANHQQIEERFNDLCAKQSQQLVNFELKTSPPPQFEEFQIKSISRGKGLRSNLKKKSTIIGVSKPNNSIRQSVVILNDETNNNNGRKSDNMSSSMHKIGQSSSSMKNLKSARSSINIPASALLSKSHTQLNLKQAITTTNMMASSHKLSPIKISPDKANTSGTQHERQLHSPEKRLTKHLELRSSQGNIRFSKKKSTIIGGSGDTKKKDEEDENASDIDDKVSQSPEWILIQQKLKNAIKNKKSDKGDDYINPVVKLFGNNFIAMVLQALVVKKIDDLYGMKLNTDSNIPISENLLKQFGISTAMLQTLNNANEKKQYIADTMTARISLMIKEWDDKQMQRQNKLKQDEHLQEKEEHRKLETQVDMFDWLKIGTNHDHLQKKLRMTIIEKLTDFENQEEISKLKSLKNKSPQNIVKNKTEIHLKNLPFVSTKVLLLRMDEKDNKYLKEGMTKEQLDQFEEVSHPDYMNENKKNSMKKNIDSSIQERKQEEQKKKDEEDELPEWSEDLEKEFLNNKRVARIIYSKDIQSSSWSQQGYLPLVQERENLFQVSNLVLDHQNALEYCVHDDKQNKFEFS